MDRAFLQGRGVATPGRSLALAVLRSTARVLGEALPDVTLAADPRLWQWSEVLALRNGAKV